MAEYRVYKSTIGPWWNIQVADLWGCGGWASWRDAFDVAYRMAAAEREARVAVAANCRAATVATKRSTR